MHRLQLYKRILSWVLVLVLVLSLVPMAFADGEESGEAPAVPVEEPQELPAEAPETESAQEGGAVPEAEEPKPDSEEPEQVKESEAPKPEVPAQEDKPLDLSREMLTAEQAEVCRRITDFLRDQMGLNDAAIAGILANIHRESAFNCNKVGDFGESYGICQWRLVRKDRLEAYCLDMDLDYTTLEAQLLFLAYELETYYPDVLEYILLNAADDVGGAERAAYYFCDTFEVPLELERNLKERSELAVRLYYPQLLDLRDKDADAAEPGTQKTPPAKESR